MHDIVISKGIVVTPTESLQADVGITGSKISGVGMSLSGDRIIDASGCFVIPGAVDVHVHFEMPVGGLVSTDTFRTGTRAALCGGTTAVIDFVEPRPNQSLLDAFIVRNQLAENNAVIDYGFHMTIPAWHADHTLDQVPEVVRRGMASFKMYRAYKGLQLDDEQLDRSFRAVANVGGIALVHCEDGDEIESLRQLALENGHTGPIWHARTRPSDLEASAVSQVIEIAQRTGVQLYVVHISCLEAAKVVDQAIRSGHDVLGETCPQYLFLDESLLEMDVGSRYICAPPLRTNMDQQALAAYVADGLIPVVSTDHCPFTATEKSLGRKFTQVPGGLASVEARLALMYNLVASGRIDLNTWVDTCCRRPASIFGLQDKGKIELGYDADIVVFDPNWKRSMGAEMLHEAVDWTPYQGMQVDGWPRMVIRDGVVMYIEGEYIEGLPKGRFVQTSPLSQ